MKKFSKKMVSFVLCYATFSACAMTAVGCGGGRSTSGGAYDPDKEIQLKIVYENKGYGIEWLDAINAAYVAKNTNVSIQVEEKTDLALENDFEIGSKNQTDIYLGNVSTGYYVYQGANAISGKDSAFVEISDVLTKENPYDSNGKTIQDKLEARGVLGYTQYHKDLRSTEYYHIPYAGGASGFLYNSNIITDVATINTSDKLISYITSGELTASGQKSTICWSNEGVEYMEYVMNTWIAQYEGKEGFDAIYNMREDGEDYSSNAYVKEGILEAYKAGEEILQYEKAYGTDKQFMALNAEFSYNCAALMPCGNWFASELTKTDDQNVNIETSPIRYMKTPVLSSIVQTLEDTSMTDDTLSAVVAAIDAGATSYNGVSENDFEAIKYARNIVYSAGVNNRAAIVSTSDNIEVAKDWLLFLASDEAANIFTQKTNTNNPYNALTTTNSGVAFLDSFTKAEASGLFIGENQYSNAFVCQYNITRYCGESSASMRFTVKNGKNYKYTAQEIYNDCVSAVKKITSTAGIN